MERIHKRKILILFSVAFLIRLIFILTLKNHFYFDDEYEYFNMVKNFLSGKGLIVGEMLKSFRPPLYPLFLSLFYGMGCSLITIRIIQVIISSFTVLLIYITGKKIFGEKVGFISAIISVLYPFFIFYTGFILTETLFIFLIVVTIYFYILTLESDKYEIKYLIQCGIYSGLSSLCRPTIEPFFLIFLLFLLMEKANFKIKIKKILIASSFFILTLSPWIIRNYVIFKKFIPATTMGGWVFWEGNNPKSEGGPCSYFPKNILKMEETKRNSYLYSLAIEEIKKNPKRFIWLLYNKFKRFWNIVPNASQFQKLFYRIISILSFGLLLPFFIIGFFLSLKKKKGLIIHAFIVYFTAFHIVFLASIRYRVAIEPFYIIFAVYGLTFFLTASVKLLFPRMKLSVIIPVFNEKATIEEIIKKVKKVPVEKEIIVVDDGSTDGTSNILKKVADEKKINNEIKIILKEKNEGKGVAIREGLKYVNGDIVVIQDADLEYDPSDWIKMLKVMDEKKADVVYGSRVLGREKKSSLAFYLGGRILSIITNFLYRAEITDEPTCYKMFRTEIIKNLSLKCKGFEFCPEVTAKIRKKGIKIYEVPIRYNPRSIKEGKKIRWKDGIIAIWTLIKYRFID